MSDETNTQRHPLRILSSVFSFVRKHKILSGISVIVLLGVGAGIAWLAQPSVPEYIKAFSERGDIVQTVEAVGEVISEKDLQLKFPVTGVVAEVFVVEGDIVTGGQRIARLRNESLAAEVRSAEANVSAQVANLHELQEGTRPEDILIAEANLANTRAALQAARTTYEGKKQQLKTAQSELERIQQEAKTSASGYLSTSQSTSFKELTVATTSLKKTDDILQKNVLYLVILSYAQADHAVIRQNRLAAEQQLTQARNSLSNGFTDYRKALEIMDNVRAAVFAAADVVDATYQMIADLPLTGNTFDLAERETQKATLATASKDAQASLSAVDTAIKNIRDASASYDTKIAAKESALVVARNAMESSEADILTFESSVRSSEAELEKTKAGARQTEIDGAQARVNQAAADVSRARARLEDTILRAPFDGVITKVEMKIGEFTGDFENISNVISMLGASPYRVEMFVAEIDIPKVQLTQTGAITLDAFPREDLTVRVSEIDPVATQIDGVPKYRVRLDFLHPRDGLRIGMSGDAEIYTDERKNVIIVPGRAVFRRDGKEFVRVLHIDGTIEERQIVTGLDGVDGELEVVSGLTEGQEIIVLIRE